MIALSKYLCLESPWKALINSFVNSICSPMWQCLIPEDQEAGGTIDDNQGLSLYLGEKYAWSPICESNDSSIFTCNVMSHSAVQLGESEEVMAFLRKGSSEKEVPWLWKKSNVPWGRKSGRLPSLQAQGKVHTGPWRLFACRGGMEVSWIKGKQNLVVVLWWWKWKMGNLLNLPHNPILWGDCFLYESYFLCKSAKARLPTWSSGADTSYISNSIMQWACIEHLLYSRSFSVDWELTGA